MTFILFAKIYFLQLPQKQILFEKTFLLSTIVTIAASFVSPVMLLKTRQGIVLKLCKWNIILLVKTPTFLSHLEESVNNSCPENHVQKGNRHKESDNWQIFRKWPGNGNFWVDKMTWDPSVPGKEFNPFTPKGVPHWQVKSSGVRQRKIYK